MNQLLPTELVHLDVDFGPDAASVIAHLAEATVGAGRATDSEVLRCDLVSREDLSATGLPGGIAIPHCRSKAVTEPTLAFARLSPTADFGCADGGADLVFMIGAPADGGKEHLKLLSALARALVKEEFKQALRGAASAKEVVAMVEEAVNKPKAKKAAADAPTPSPAASPAPLRRIIAITACPTGIAHTYMAADSLVDAGKKMGVDVQVETQGSSGSTPFDPAVIEQADAVIFATDVGVKGRGRFAGLPVVDSGVKRAINEPSKLIETALNNAEDPNGPRVEGSPESATTTATSGTRSDVGFGSRLRQALMTGVSYMIPFVAAGGLLIAIGFLLGGYKVDPTVATTQALWNLPPGGLITYIGAVCMFLGKAAFTLFIPALGGYIAYAIADRPGIAPGFVMGLVATGTVTDGLPGIGAGFLGAIVGGLLAGFIAKAIGGIKVPRWVRGLMPVVIIPLGTTILAGFLMVMVLGRPLAAATKGLEGFLGGMSGTSAVLLGVILGLMMCFDLGGPVNKAAYAFATTGLGALSAAQIAAGGAPQLKIMAAVMASGMVPPLALALASALRPKLFTPAEQENGKAAWLLGASFISEGAIPFAAADPLRVIPAAMLGGAVTGALCMATGVTLAAPHGGIFVFFAIGNVVMFLVSIIAGTIVSALATIALKQFTRSRTAGDAETVTTSH